MLQNHLTKSLCFGILNLTDEVISELKSKHSDGADANDSVMLTGEIPFVDPVMFENLKESTI